MSCEYVREHYEVPAEIGRRVVAHGRPGVIAADRGHYLGVNFDADKPGVVRNVHPTDRVEYLGMGSVRKRTKAQQRYAAYRDNAECYESFADFLGIRKSRSS